MIITPNGSGVSGVELQNEYAVAYNSPEILALAFVDGEITTRHTLEVFGTAQELADRVLALGLNVQPGHLVTALEHGVELTAGGDKNLMNYLFLYPNEGLQMRLDAIGYEYITEELIP